MSKAYSVIKIDELIRPADQGGVETYSRVTIKTRTGQRATVDIDGADLTPEKAAPALEKKARDIDGIMEL